MDAVAEPNARVCLQQANGVGKDAVSAWLVEWFLYCYEGVVPTTSASGRQVELLWQEIHNWSTKSKAASAFELLSKKMYLKADRAAYATGFKARDAATMEGFHYPHMLYIATEARGIEEWGYVAMLKACTGLDNRLLIQSVPGDATGEFWAVANGFRGDRWKVRQFPAARLDPITGKYVPTTRLVSQESIEEKLMYGEESPWFVGPVLAQFYEGGSLALLTAAQYQAACDRYEQAEENGTLPGGSDILGVDVAWKGSNESILCHRKGPVIQDIQHYQGQSELDTARRCEEWLQAHSKGVMVVEYGIAQAGVIDKLNEDGYEDRLVQVLPGNPPVDEEKFADRKSELYYYATQRFKDGNIYIPEAYRESPLGKQLTSIRKIPHGANKFQVESKRQLMARKIPSPDWSDAYMLSNAVADDEFAEYAGWRAPQGVGERTEPDW